MLVTNVPGHAPAQPFKWPQDLDSIKLTSEEALTISAVALKTWQHILSNSKMQASAKRNHYIFLKAGQQVRDSEGLLKHLPRSLLICHHRALVLLYSKGSSEKASTKYAWDLIQGERLLKRSIEASYQANFYKLLSQNFFEDTSGFPDIAMIRASDSKLTIFERCYPMTLTKSILEGLHRLEIVNLSRLQTALATIHSLVYPPNNSLPEAFPLKRTYSGPCFHGDISPGNIVFEDPSRHAYFNYRLVNVGKPAHIDGVAWTLGWGSPEAIQYALTKTRNQQLSPIEFNRNFGQKKDVWALALIIGSLLSGRFERSKEGSLMPNFQFIMNKLKYTESGIDESGLADLTQREIDKELDAIIAPFNSRTGLGRLLRFWWFHVKIWLRVDPNERPSITIDDAKAKL